MSPLPPRPKPDDPAADLVRAVENWPTEAALVETRAFQIEEICRMFGVSRRVLEASPYTELIAWQRRIDAEATAFAADLDAWIASRAP